MDEFAQFLRAALPWVAMGLLIAVFAVRSASRRKKEGKEEPTKDYGVEGMCLGMCFGTAIGTSLGNNTGLGISLGMLIGLAIGSCFKKEARGKDGEE